LDSKGKITAENLPEDCVLLLRVCINASSLRVQVIDNGIGMAQEKAGVESIEEFTEKGGRGGLGTYIIRNFMDEVDYDYPPDRGTILTMTKYLRTANS
ncbi:MAG: ATP-binding protein, partial [Candidatus Sumerlaeia bacterium]|nr:ATP-binding protein [Candidatus Sumerlaeia bacterium]